jgi:hypothetical protein
MDSVTRSNELDTKIVNLALGGKTNRRIIHFLVVSVIFDIILSLGLGLLALNASTIANETRQQSVSRYQTCVTQNIRYNDQVNLWTYALSGMKLNYINHANLLRYIRTIYTQRECVTSDPVPTIYYSTQTVLSKVHNVKGPAARINQKVVVRGNLCVPATVKASGSLEWIMIYPTKLVLPSIGKTATLHKGCKSLIFRNRIPSSVVSVAKSEFAKGYVETIWRIRGTVVPLPSNESVVTWETKQFQLVP